MVEKSILNNFLWVTADLWVKNKNICFQNVGLRCNCAICVHLLGPDFFVFLRFCENCCFEAAACGSWTIPKAAVKSVGSVPQFTCFGIRGKGLNALLPIQPLALPILAIVRLRLCQSVLDSKFPNLKNGPERIRSQFSKCPERVRSKTGIARTAARCFRHESRLI